MSVTIAFSYKVLCFSVFFCYVTLRYVTLRYHQESGHPTILFYHLTVLDYKKRYSQKIFLAKPLAPNPIKLDVFRCVRGYILSVSGSPSNLSGILAPPFEKKTM